MTETAISCDGDPIKQEEDTDTPNAVGNGDDGERMHEVKLTLPIESNDLTMDNYQNLIRTDKRKVHFKYRSERHKHKHGFIINLYPEKVHIFVTILKRNFNNGVGYPRFPHLENVCGTDKDEYINCFIDQLSSKAGGMKKQPTDTYIIAPGTGEQYTQITATIAAFIADPQTQQILNEAILNDPKFCLGSIGALEKNTLESLCSPNFSPFEDILNPFPQFD